MVSRKRNPHIYWAQTEEEVNIKIDLRLDDMVSSRIFTAFNRWNAALRVQIYNFIVRLLYLFELHPNGSFATETIKINWNSFTETEYQNQAKIIALGCIWIWFKWWYAEFLLLRNRFVRGGWHWGRSGSGRLDFVGNFHHLLTFFKSNFPIIFITVIHGLDFIDRYIINI